LRGSSQNRTLPNFTLAVRGSANFVKSWPPAGCGRIEKLFSRIARRCTKPKHIVESCIRYFWGSYDLLVKTLRIRLKDKHTKTLEAMARECNLVWNFVNDLSQKHVRRTGKFFSAFEIARYTSGATKEGLQIHSQTVQGVTEKYVRRRAQFRKAKLRWRCSRGSRKSLGWIPFKVGAVTFRAGQLRYAGYFFSLWDSYGLAGHKNRSGNFCEDSRGRWYANLCVETAEQKSLCKSAVGIDLGLKDFAVLSTGEKIAAPKIYRDAQPMLAVMQRARKPRQVKALHAKIANRRKDFLHKLSTRLVSEYGAIYVGNVNTARLAKTKMAKSALDASWSTFRTMLQYKSIATGTMFMEVNEAYSTVTCSACNARSGPSGLKGLRIREWKCSECGAQHDRDFNAAENILRRGHATLAVGIPDIAIGKDAKSPLLLDKQLEYDRIW
jgi:putative transposase